MSLHFYIINQFRLNLSAGSEWLFFSCILINRLNLVSQTWERTIAQNVTFTKVRVTSVASFYALYATAERGLCTRQRAAWKIAET